MDAFSAAFMPINMASDMASFAQQVVNLDQSIRGFEYSIQDNDRKFAYQKELNKMLMARDDNAVSRRVADMKAAGLSPVLAAGGAAATSQLGNTPSQNLVSSPSVNGSNLASMMSSLAANRQANTAAELSKAQSNLINTQAEYLPQTALSEINYKNSETQYKKDRLPYEISLLQAERHNKGAHTGYLFSQKYLTETQERLARAGIKFSQKDIDRINAEIAYKEMLTQTAETDNKYRQQEIEKLLLDIEILKFYNDNKKIIGALDMTNKFTKSVSDLVGSAVDLKMSKNTMKNNDRRTQNDTVRTENDSKRTSVLSNRSSKRK